MFKIYNFRRIEKKSETRVSVYLSDRGSFGTQWNIAFLEWTYFSQYAGSEIPELTTGSGTATGGQLVHDAQCVNAHWATLCLPNSWNTYYHFLTGHEVSYSILILCSY